MARGSGVVARRHHLHRRDLQGGREDDLRQGRLAGGPSGLFNSSLEGNTRRAIDFREGDKIDEEALKALIRAAVALNMSAATAAPPLPEENRERVRGRLRAASAGATGEDLNRTDR